MQNNLFFEILPLITFFAAYCFTKNLFIATAVCVVFSWISLIICKIKFKKIGNNTWISTTLITVFGGLTVLLHNKTFIMLKPTVLFWILGFGLLIGQYLGKNSIELMLGKELTLSVKLWSYLNTAWGIFFIVMGGINVYVALNFSEYVWVKFKVFGSLGLTVLFTIISGIIVLVVQNKHNKLTILTK